MAGDTSKTKGFESGTLILRCRMCSDTYVATVPIPEAWYLPSSEIDAEDCLCPGHGEIRGWIESQCPGCVGGWGDCGLWRDFAYDDMRLSVADMSAIFSGRCPRRINGTYAWSGDSGADIDLSQVSDAGEALADAVYEYRKTYAKAQQQ